MTYFAFRRFSREQLTILNYQSYFTNSPQCEKLTLKNILKGNTEVTLFSGYGTNYLLYYHYVGQFPLPHTKSNAGDFPSFHFKLVWVFCLEFLSSPICWTRFYLFVFFVFFYTWAFTHFFEHSLKNSSLHTGMLYALNKEKPANLFLLSLLLYISEKWFQFRFSVKQQAYLAHLRSYLITHLTNRQFLGS